LAASGNRIFRRQGSVCPMLHPKLAETILPM